MSLEVFFSYSHRDEDHVIFELNSRGMDRAGDVLNGRSVKV
jgi:hypothetical protein